MRAILIDPFSRQVRETEVKGDLKSIHAAIGCRTIECGPPVPGHVIYINGDMPVSEHGAVFSFDGYVIGGRALVLGVCPYTGNELPSKLAVEVVGAQIRWAYRIDQNIITLAEETITAMSFWGVRSRLSPEDRTIFDRIIANGVAVEPHHVKKVLDWRHAFWGQHDPYEPGRA